jgi:hypothetical protein
MKNCEFEPRRPLRFRIESDFCRNLHPTATYLSDSLGTSADSVAVVQPQCMTASRRVAAPSATSSAQKTWTRAVAEEEAAAAVVVKFVSRHADRVGLTRTRPWADIKRVSNPIAKLMTGNVQVVGSPCHRDPHSPAGPELVGRCDS